MYEENIQIAVRRILELMTQKNVNKSELAARCGWPMSKLSKILYMQQKINIEDLIMIGCALGINPALLISPDMSDVVEKKEPLSLADIFVNLVYCEGNYETIEKMIESELPYTIMNSLSLSNTGKSVEVILRPKRQSFSLSSKEGYLHEREYVRVPRVIVTDKSEGQLFGNQLTMGYWFDEDLKTVYLAINYTKKAFNKNGVPTNINGLDNHVMTSFKDMRDMFYALFEYEGLYSEKMRLCGGNYHEGGATIYCIKYDLCRHYDESKFKEDLVYVYEMYKKLLVVATERVLETYENIYQERIEEDRKERAFDDGKRFELSDLDRVMPIRMTGKESYMPKIRLAALERENYKCEIDETHETFVNRERKPHMQVHTLIPMKYQKEFTKNLQFGGNYCCVCPICYAKLEYGEDSDRQELLMTLYLKHKEEFINAGFNITPMQLFKMYGMS